MIRAIILTLFCQFFVAVPVLAGSISSSHPDGIVCRLPASGDRPEGLVAFYLAAILVDGQVLYQTLGNQVLSVTFDAQGNPRENAAGVCEGKTLSELIADGMTFGN